MRVNKMLRVLADDVGTEYDFQKLFEASGYKSRKRFQRKLEMFLSEGIIKQTYNLYWVDTLGLYYLKRERLLTIWIPVVISTTLSIVAVVVSILSLCFR